jgi:subtilisin family serine protease
MTSRSPSPPVRSFAAVALLVAALAGAPLTASPARADDVRPLAAQDRFAPIPGEREYTGRLIVKPRPGPEAVATATARLNADGAAIFRTIPETGEWLVTPPAGTTDGDYAKALSADASFLYAEPDWLCFPLGTPNDPSFAAQYHHQRIATPRAWDFTTGSTTIIYSMVDTGVALNHPDLLGRFVPGYNVPLRLPQASGGDVSDVNGHGTFIAGCVGANGNNAVGITGVAWAQTIMPVRASDLPNGAAPLSELQVGARWAADNGARVISVSYSGVANASVETTGQYARARNALLFWAAGNNGQTIAGSDHPTVTVVGASDEIDALASFSNRGDLIDLVAPGQGIFSTEMTGGYGLRNGTSFATPIAAGVACLIWSLNPALTPAEVEQLLLSGCEDLGPPGNDALFGRGRLNAHRALSLTALGNAIPFAANESIVVEAGRPVFIDALRNDAPSTPGGVLNLVVGGGATAGGGQVALSPAGEELPLGLFYTPPNTPGTDTIAYTVVGDAGQATATVSVTIVAPGTLATAVSAPETLPGLDAAIFDLGPVSPTSTQDLAGRTPDNWTAWSTVNFSPTSGHFADTGLSDNFGIVATGFFVAESDGLYTFGLTCNEGARLFINGSLVVDHDGLHAFSYKPGTALLREGLHALRIEYIEAFSVAGLVASVEGPRTGIGPIPSTLLRRYGPPTLDVDASGSVNPDDLADFIAFFFLTDHRADFDRSGLINPDDLADFITAYFAP